MFRDFLPFSNITFFGRKRNLRVNTVRQQLPYQFPLKIPRRSTSSALLWEDPDHVISSPPQIDAVPYEALSPGKIIFPLDPSLVG